MIWKILTTQIREDIYDSLIADWFGPEKLDSILSKMYKISAKVIKFITEAMKNWNEKIIAEMKIQRGFLLVDAQLPFVIAIIQFNHIYSKFSGDYKFTKSKKKIEHLMFMDDFKLFGKN